MGTQGRESNYLRWIAKKIFLLRIWRCWRLDGQSSRFLLQIHETIVRLRLLRKWMWKHPVRPQNRPQISTRVHQIYRFQKTRVLLILVFFSNRFTIACVISEVRLQMFSKNFFSNFFFSFFFSFSQLFLHINYGCKWR